MPLTGGTLSQLRYRCQAEAWHHLRDGLATGRPGDRSVMEREQSTRPIVEHAQLVERLHRHGPVGARTHVAVLDADRHPGSRLAGTPEAWQQADPAQPLSATLGHRLAIERLH